MTTSFFFFTVEFFSPYINQKRNSHSNINRFTQVRVKYSAPLLVSLRPFGWNEWAMSLLGLFDLSCLELDRALCDFSLLSFYNFKNQRILNLTLISQFLLFLESLLSSLLASKYLVLWESRCAFNLFWLHIWSHIIVLGVDLSPYTWETDVVHHSPVPSHERTPDADLETAVYRMVSL